MEKETSLTAVREKIDGLDKQIQTLISERAALALEVAKVKIASGDQEADFYRPAREANVLRDVIARNSGDLPDAEMARLFREIMSACLAAEKPIEVAYLGPEGSFTQAAGLKQFGGSVRLNAYPTIADVFHAVEVGNSHYGMVPVENSTEGVVSHTLDRFIDSPLKINGEVSLRIHHYLLSKETDNKAIQKIYAHPQALAQCRHWLQDNMADCEQIAVSSNSEAARLVAETPNSAAIAGDRAAEIYGLSAVAKHIEDEANNTTRFLVVGHQSVPMTGEDKTALLVSTKNESGALQTLLKPLADNGISMSRIESRPARTGIWEYVFFIDIDGHQEDPIVATALAQLVEQSAICRVLGSYPKAVI
jgi:chorismate mutase/prephenate dehydratase